MALRLAHAVVVTPGRCGLYETTRELVVSLRALGVDSRMVDPLAKELHTDDRGAVMADLEWGKTADVLVNHSGLGSKLEETNQPVVHVAHGRPRSSFLAEVSGNTSIYSYHYHKNKDPRFKAVVTFWPEHRAYHEVMWPNTPIYVVTAPVDLEVWTPDGPRGYNFSGKKGSCNVICTDAWRDDIDPFTVVNAFALYSRKYKGAKLHIYGRSKNLRGWSALLKTIQDQGNLGEVRRWVVSGLDHVYRAADVLITPHIIAVRSKREAMACGCPVAVLDTMRLEKFVDDIQTARVQDRRDVREQAEKQFNPAKTAKQFLAVVNSINLERNV